MNDKVLEILNLIETLDDESLKEALLEYYEPDIADALEELDEEQNKRVRDLLPQKFHSEVLANIEDQEEYTKTLTDLEVANLVKEMESNEARMMLDSLSEERKEEILAYLPQDVKDEISLLDSYEDDEVGSFMNTDFVLLDDSFTIAKAMRKVIEAASQTDNFTQLYVLNQDGTYRGVVSLKDLIIARKDYPFVELIKENYPILHDRDKVDTVNEIIVDYTLDSYPILDQNNNILGILTSDTAKELVETNYSEDFGILGGVEIDDINEKPFRAVLKRLPWLLVLLLVATGVSMISSSFEAIIASLVTVVFFQSMIADMAGNVGTQALAIVIGQDFSKETPKKEMRKTVLKEMAIGAFNGVILGIFSFLVVIVALLIMGKSGSVLYQTALTVGLSILGVSTLSSFIGSFIPTLLIRLNVDPAVASGPFITTFNDIVAVLLYFGLAYLFFYILV